MKIRIAVDRNDNRISVDEAVSRGDYFCEACGKPLIFRNGEVRVKHFAHKPNLTCSDNWNYGNDSETYDTSEWHNGWQANYPKQNIEVIIPFQSIKHRADVLIGKTVIEFQHSPINSSHFQERTNYYLNLGYKVIWLFDYVDEYSEGKISNPDNKYEWSRPRSAFRDVTGMRDNVDLFFQLKEEGDCIAKVTEINPNGFEVFWGSKLLSKDEFLTYTGLENGSCELPSVEKVKDINDDLQAFNKKYNVVLDKQQLRAVQSVEGANLVLAVPGSGKTTVLTYRLGYMTLVKGIKPENILAITFTNNAADEMRNRMKQYFRGDIKGYIDIRTINSLSLNIVMQKNGGINNTADDSVIRKILVDLFIKHRIQFFADTIKLYNSAICFAKSKLDQERALVEALSDARLEQFRTIFKEYNDALNEKGLVDFNDQNNLALKYLKEDPELLSKYQDKYKYICVDEAQDTNQVQYEMIKLLAGKENNIFMVGDEDQSIYGFNGSYPEALLNFRDEYTNPFILRLERNYRSTNQIVDLARCFIEKNIKRNKKEIYAYRGDGKEVTKFDVTNVAEQSKVLLEEIKKSNKKVAILYRENSSAIPVIHEMLNQRVSYSLLKNEIDFFRSSNYKKIESIIRLAINPCDFDAFMDARGCIYYQLYPKAIKGANQLRIKEGFDNLFDALKKWLQLNPFKDSWIIEQRAKTVKEQVKEIASLPVEKAISEACKIAIYNEIQRQKVEGLLLPISKDVKSLQEFLNSIGRIKSSIAMHAEANGNERIKLGTIHSAKGMEFETVYLIDIYDGVFPSIPSSQNQKLYEEERRVFYVAMTRAKDELYVFKNTSKSCGFVDELFPDLSTYYDVMCLDSETKQSLLPLKRVEATIGDHVIEEAPPIEGYICNNNKAEKTLDEMDHLIPITFLYTKKKYRIHFIVLPGVFIAAGKDTTVIPINEKEVIAPSVLISPDSVFEWYLDEGKTVLADKRGLYLMLPDTEISNEEYTDITFYGCLREKPRKTLFEIGDEIDFKKVLIVENNNGQKERITQSIYEMYRKYHCVYGDNGPINDFNQPIWKVVSKL